MAATRLMEIDVEQLEPDPENVRREYDPEVIRGLASFFKDQGTFIENPVVWQVGTLPDGRALYRAFSGSTRAQAARSVGGKITVQVLPDAPEGSGKLLGQLAAGLVKGELKPLDISHTLAELQREGGKSVQDLVRELADWGIRRSRFWVFQHLHLGDLIPEVQEMVRQGQVPLAAVSVLYNKGREEQLRLAAAIASGSVNLSEAAAGAGPAEAIQGEINQRIADGGLAPERSVPAVRRKGGGGQRPGAIQTRRLLLGIDDPDELARLGRSRALTAKQLPAEAWAAQASEEERALAHEALYLGQFTPDQAVAAVGQWQQEAEIAPDEVLIAAHGMKRLIDLYTRNPEGLMNYPGLMTLLQLRATALTRITSLAHKQEQRR